MPIYSDLNKRDASVRPRVVGVEAILQSVENVLSIGQKQALFNPRGVRLNHLLFELADDEVEFAVKNLVYEALQEEPRVTLDWALTTAVRTPERHELRVKLVYNILGYTEQKYERAFTIRK